MKDLDVYCDYAALRIHINLTTSALSIGEAKEFSTNILKAINAIENTYTLISRKKAKDAGLLRFFTGKPCIHGHICERMVSNKACVQCLHAFRRSTEERRIKDNRRRHNLQKATPEKRKARNRKERLRERAKLGRILRNRMNLALKNKAKGGSAVRDLGCSIEEFKSYIELKFLSGMSWNNYGMWELDHIRPLCSFNLSERQDFLLAAHYSNYQPLWKEANRAKGKKYEKEG